MSDSPTPFRIALLSSFTFDGIVDELRDACTSIGLPSECWVAPYNQYQQTILDETSQLYRFRPDLTILFVDYRSVFGDALWSWNEMKIEDRKNVADQKVKELTDLIDAWASRGSGTLLVHNLEIPTSSPLGILETKDEFGFHDAIRGVDAGLAAHVRHLSNVFVFDFDAFMGAMGKRAGFDWKMYYLADIKFNPKATRALADAYLGYIKPLTSRNRKCLVLDLDNTLWGGVVGEAGSHGIELGPTPTGRPFWEFQKYLKSFVARGVILAINSKNNPDDALDVLRNHPYMVLREDQFAAIRMNWEDKIANMKALAEEINIGLDSMVFFDDDPFNRALMRELLPEVLTLEVPNDPAKYVSAISEMTDFNILQLTEEDRKKGSLYAAERKRRDVRGQHASLEDFLKQLELVVRVEAATDQTIPRIAQLTQKTNQFTMTTRRYTEDDIRRMRESGTTAVVALSASDRFGDHGLTGAAMVTQEGGVWTIDSLLLSCRILGKGIENVFLSHLIREAQRAGAMEIVGEFIPTAKNSPAESLYRDSGFRAHGPNHWRLDVTNAKTDIPPWITLLTS